MEMRLVTGSHCITAIREELDGLLREEDHLCSTSGYHVNFEFDYKNTWDSEMYILYNVHGCPIGIARPAFDRTDRIVTGLIPSIFKPHRGKGYASYMFAWLIEHYFKQNQHKICTTVYGCNTASLKLCRKFFIEEGVRSEHVYIDGNYYSSHLFGLIRSRYTDTNLPEYVKIRERVLRSLSYASNLDLGITTKE
jgi:RimJ/RimL family protein N-acetyltransferase